LDLQEQVFTHVARFAVRYRLLYPDKKGTKLGGTIPISPKPSLFSGISHQINWSPLQCQAFLLLFINFSISTTKSTIDDKASVRTNSFKLKGSVLNKELKKGTYVAAI